jgi:hypothetical protein
MVLCLILASFDTVEGAEEEAKKYVLKIENIDSTSRTEGAGVLFFVNLIILAKL